MNASFHKRLGLIVAAVVGLGCAMPASASLVLFPGTTSEVIDGGPGDMSGAVNDTIIIDANNPLAVPGTGGTLLFSGMVEHGVAGSITVGQAIGLRAIRITEDPNGNAAVLHNSGTGTFALGGNQVDWVQYDYATLDPAGIANMADLAIHFEAWLDTTPGGGTLASTDQRLGMSVQADTWWEWAAGAPDFPMAAQWNNPGSTATALQASGWNASVGDYDISAGRMLITLDDIVLEAGERFEFPSSVNAGLVAANATIVPEPASATLMLLGGAWMLRRRR
ncbi:MAG: PEP-CTERM sorting domain-containing protein [Phycisphaeraceae bacterium]